MTGVKMSVQKPNYVALDNEIKKNTDYLKANKTYLEQIVKIISTRENIKFSRKKPLLVNNNIYNF